MANASVKITGPAAGQLSALAKKVQDKGGLLVVLQRQGVEDLRGFYRDQNVLHPNKLGGTRTNFWKMVSDTVHAGKVGKTQAAISIGHEAIRQKAEGGEIVAKRTKFLSIPINAESYGHSPRESQFAGRLRFQRLKGKPGGLLIDKESGAALFILKPSVKQKPDKAAIPPADIQKEMADHLIQTAKDFLEFEQLGE